MEEIPNCIYKSICSYYKPDCIQKSCWRAKYINGMMKDSFIDLLKGGKLRKLINKYENRRDGSKGVKDNGI